jgi:hypothetical protein
MQEKIVFTIKGKQYESLPLTVGRSIDFYKLRAFIAGGQYQNMYGDYSNTPERVLDMIDCKAFFGTLCPKFIEDIKPGNVDDLGLQDFEEVLMVYRKTIKPYLEEMKEYLSKKDEMVS